MLTQPKPTRSRYSTMLTQSRLCVLLFLLCLDKIGIEHSLLQPVAGGVSLLGKIFFYLQTGYGGCPTGAVSGIFYINSNGDFGIVLRGKGNKDTVVFAVGILGSAGLTADFSAGLTASPASKSAVRQALPKIHKAKKIKWFSLWGFCIVPDLSQSS